MQARNFFRKLCIAYRNLSHDDFPETDSKEMLKTKIRELEKELKLAREEKDNALSENRNKIDELTVALLSIKTKVNELVQAKREKEKRLRDLSGRIRREAR